jgi:hypothetical protein
MVAQRCINDFSASSSANIRTGLKTNIRDGRFKRKPGLINMVLHSPFYSKALEDANGHRGVTQDAVHLCLFPFSLLAKGKQWFYSNKEAVST